MRKKIKLFLFSIKNKKKLAVIYKKKEPSDCTRRRLKESARIYAISSVIIRKGICATSQDPSEARVINSAPRCASLLEIPGMAR